MDGSERKNTDAGALARAEGSDDQRHAAANPEAVRVAHGACWSCHGPVPIEEVFCPTCQAIQSPGTCTHFQRLGITPGFAVDERALQRRYFDWQRQLHPDRFATRTSRERALSQQQATAINEAYETLKDPLSRAEYLLRQGADGAVVSPEGCILVNDQELLTEQLEMREALADAESADAVRALTRRANTDIEQCIAALAEAFAAGDRGRAAKFATRLKYLRKLADDCRIRRLQITGDR